MLIAAVYPGVQRIVFSRCSHRSQRLGHCTAAMPDRYAIMMAGHTNSELEQKYGDFARMTQALLQDGEQLEGWDTFYTCDGQFPSPDELPKYQVRQGLQVVNSPRSPHLSACPDHASSQYYLRYRGLSSPGALKTLSVRSQL